MPGRFRLAWQKQAIHSPYGCRLVHPHSRLPEVRNVSVPHTNRQRLLPFLRLPSGNTFPLPGRARSTPRRTAGQQTPPWLPFPTLHPTGGFPDHRLVRFPAANALSCVPSGLRYEAVPAHSTSRRFRLLFLPPVLKHQKQSPEPVLPVIARPPSSPALQRNRSLLQHSHPNPHKIDILLLPIRSSPCVPSHRTHHRTHNLFA